MENVRASELASSAADAFRTSVHSAEPNSGKMDIALATNLGSS